MDFKEKYPDFAPIEEHIRRARIERSAALAQIIADLIDSTGRGLKRLAAGLARGLAAARDRRAIESPAFLERPVPHR